MSNLTTAIHEAAHAVIARKLGLSCGLVTLVPEDKVRAELDGNGKFVRLVPDGKLIAHAEISQRWSPPKKTSAQERAEAYAVALYAGHEAELEICGKAVGNNAHDRDSAVSAVGDDPVLVMELRDRARGLVREHRAVIERVADALLERRTLYGGEVHVLVEMD